MKKKYWYIIGIVIIVAGVVAWFTLKKKSSEKVEYRSSQVEHGDIRIVVTATGTLSADTTVQVGTQVSGIISKIFVDFNSVVKKGDVVALLDTTYLAAALEDAASSLYRAQVQVDLTKRTFDRTKKLFEEKVMAQADYDQALSDYETAKGNLRSAKSSLERARINLKYATIVAPVSGVVISRAVDRGQTVAASFNTPTLFTIANDLTKMQVQASVDEADIGKIRVGQEVSFTVDAYTDQTFNGTVRQIRLQPTVTQNVVNYTVIIDVPNEDMKLMPGMTANITVKIQEVQNVMRVPASALRFWPAQDNLATIMKELPDSTKKMLEAAIALRAKRNQKGTGKSWGSSDGAMAGNNTTGQSKNASAQKQTGVKTSPSFNTTHGPMSAKNQAANQSWTPGSRHGDHHWKGNDQPGNATIAKSDKATIPSGQQLEIGKNREPEQIRMRTAIIWVKQGEKLVPVKVKSGLTDGSYTQVEGKLKDGEEIITGIVNSTQQAGSQQQQSPFMPQMGRPASTRGGR